ncbi:hypothetical protein [Winogradskyella helgolandensis]|uniref:hypothetical protein n=1 Tax=Winogradskyella helgolandensis TaxID=2697010 RepID=UPI0015C14F1C|nr:hypothetical protein [Winogradskyella helgolandensis]
MKTAFKTYLSLFFVLVLNVFASLQANNVISSITEVAACSNLNASKVSIESTDSNATANYSPLTKDTDKDLLFDIIEISEGEEDELSSRYKASFKDYLEILLIYAKLFENASDLQKNNYRPQSAINDPSLRLHIQFQVFII